MIRAGITTQTVILVLGLSIAAVGLVLGLVFLAGPEGQQGALQWLSNIAVLVITGTSTGTLILANRTNKSQQVTQAAVAQVQENTNGLLTSRISDAVTEGIADAAPPSHEL